MKIACCLVLALTVVRVSSSTLLSSHYPLNGFNNLHRGLAHFGTSSDHCHCVQTIVRPKLRTHIATIPALHRYLRTKTIPVIQRVPYSITRKVNTPSFPLKTGILPSGLTLKGINGIGMSTAFPRASSSVTVFPTNGYVNTGLGGYQSDVC